MAIGDEYFFSAFVSIVVSNIIAPASSEGEYYLFDYIRKTHYAVIYGTVSRIHEIDMQSKC